MRFRGAGLTLEHQNKEQHLRDEYLNDVRSYKSMLKATISKVQKHNREVSNAKFAKTDQNFKDACELAGLEATSRQASKFRNKQGKAFGEWRSVQNAA
jgi:uncharacterized protein YnzC (UPF0291/DUF896 family)